MSNSDRFHDRPEHEPDRDHSQASKASEPEMFYEPAADEAAQIGKADTDIFETVHQAYQRELEAGHLWDTDVPEQLDAPDMSNEEPITDREAELLGDPNDPFGIRGKHSGEFSGEPDVRLPEKAAPESDPIDNDGGEGGQGGDGGEGGQGGDGGDGGQGGDGGDGGGEGLGGGGRGGDEGHGGAGIER